MGKRIYTDGNLFVETWIGDEDKEVSQVSVSDTGVFHVIEVENGSTVTRDIKVVGSLPQDTRRLAFKVPQNRDRWEDTLRSLTSKADKVKCEIEILSGKGDERVQCSTVEYQDSGNPSWQQCTQGIPVEITIQVA